MALLVSSLVDEVHDTWRSYVREQSPVTALDGSLTDSALTFTVDDATKISTGVLQIEDELVQVRSVDLTTRVVTLEPWGRAQMNSTAAAHADGAKITVNPSTPRARVRDIISDVVQEIFPTIFAVDDTTLDITPAVVNYDLPTDAYHVLSVQWQPAGPSLSWLPVPRWKQNKTTTTNEIEIISVVMPGAGRVRVFYQKNPPDQLTFTDDLSTMGYPVSIRGVIVVGALHRLAMFTENSRIQTGSVEAHTRAESVPAGSAIALSRYLYQVFRQRLEDEGRNLQMRYPIVSHFAR